MLFGEKVLKIVAEIPAWQVLTYQEVARRAGSPRAYRAVGNILNKNDNPMIPCHRVIRSDGKLGGYNLGAVVKRCLLEKEAKILRASPSE